MRPGQVIQGHYSSEGRSGTELGPQYTSKLRANVAAAEVAAAAAVAAAAIAAGVTVHHLWRLLNAVAPSVAAAPIETILRCYARASVRSC